MDRLTVQKRSALMSRRRKHTCPELVVRRTVQSLGLRFRLRRKDLPGQPNLVFPKYRTVAFVNGCFWHRHPGWKKASMPKSNVDFWRGKFVRNVERDAKNCTSLEAAGWRVIIICECQTKFGNALDKIRSIPARILAIYSPSESPCQE